MNWGISRIIYIYTCVALKNEYISIIVIDGLVVWIASESWIMSLFVYYERFVLSFRTIFMIVDRS